MEFEDYLKADIFYTTLLKKIKPFISQHFAVIRNDSSIDFDSYGSDEEVRLKKILNLSSNLSIVLKDFDYNFIYLEKKRDEILKHYPAFDNHEDYYNYHYENHYIRLVTLGDIIGRLGNLIYDTKLEEKQASPHTFKNVARKNGHILIANITEDLIQKLNPIKDERHNKLHTGKSKLEALKGVVIWDDLARSIDSNFDEILTEYSTEQINKRIEFLKNETFEIIDCVELFLKEATKMIN